MPWLCIFIMDVPMRIAIFGTGGVGGYFGGRLAQAGEDVVFIARGAHLESIRDQGLRVESIAGNFSISPASVEEDPHKVGPVDAVILAVKGCQVEAAAASMKPMIGPKTVVLPLLNGVDIPARLSAVLGHGPVIGGLCRIIALRGGPGLIRHLGANPSLCFGELNNTRSARVQNLQAAFTAAEGLTVTISSHIVADMWEKLLFVGPLGAVGAVSRVPVGLLRSVPETRAMLRQAMQEVRNLAQARSIPLPADVVDRAFAIVDRMAGKSTTSMQRDIMEGHHSELTDQVGVIVRLGIESGVATPIHSVIYHSLLPQEMLARGEVSVTGQPDSRRK